jgi:phosphoesterase RecJ-like protein
MNYNESQKILEQINKSNNILINCHRSPDPDSVGSSLSLYLILKELGKENITIICPDETPFNCKFLPNADVIKKVDFNEFDYSQFDLFFAVDSGSWNQVTGKDKILESGINTIVIDHHFTNPKFGNINILDVEAGSCAAVVYKFAKDLNINIKEDLATTMLTGIVGDTISFQTDVIGDSAFAIADDLIKCGADRNKVIFNLYKSKSLDEIHFMGTMLSNTHVDSDYKFAWVAISKEESSKYPTSKDAKSSVAGSFISAVADTDFGFVLEETSEFVSVSFRTRKNFDVSKIAEELGGGGHKSASAARLVGMNFDDAVEKVLYACRKYANKKD